MRGMLGGLMILGASMLTACSSDDINDPAKIKPGSDPDYYIHLQIEFPKDGNTRSTTTDGGTSADMQLDAFDKENGISKITLYFFDATGTTSATNGQLICSFSTSGNPALDVTQGSDKVSYTLVQQVSYDDLRAMFGKYNHIYAIANIDGPTVTVNAPGATGVTTESSFLSDNKVTVADITSASLARSFATGYNNNLPMANYSCYNLDLTSFKDKINANSTNGEVINAVTSLFTGTYGDGRLWDASTYAKSDNGNVDALRLERMVARIDYKDGASTSIAPNTYKLANHSMEIVSGSTKSNEDVYLCVQSLQLFNVNKSSYYFRHTATGTNSGVTYDATNGFPVSPFGVEKGSDASAYNWVADPSWVTKYNITPADNSLALASSNSLFFNQPTEDSEGVWSITGNTSRTATTTFADWIENASDADKTTIGSGYAPWYYLPENTVPSTSKMTTHFCTGIAFHVLVMKKSDDTYVPVTKTDAPELRINRNDGYYQEPEWKDGEAGSYPAGYYLTYKYLIPHNISTNTDASTDGSVDGNTGLWTSVGPMQYAVVRNNVYQLCLTGIENLPNYHEPDNVILSIDLRVMDWNARWDEEVVLH